MADATGIMQISPVIPVVTIENPEHAVPVAEALLEGGVRIIELTLRTGRALESLRRIATEVPGILTGAGTVLTPAQADAAADAGAQFLVSPGTTTVLLKHMLTLGMPVLPGVANAGQAMEVLEHGIEAMKFFPAGPAGGAAYLAALAAPMPQVTFCPTGGISLATAPDYLALPTVPCVGGSWLVPQAALDTEDWGRITDLARQATELAGQGSGLR